MADTLTMPEHGIMCFHCREVFTDEESAREHFGPHEHASPGCTIDLGAFRECETERDELRREVERLTMAEYALDLTHTELRRYFGTWDPWTIHDRYDNERFRAEHAVSLLDAHGIPFDREVTPRVLTDNPREEE